MKWLLSLIVAAGLAAAAVAPDTAGQRALRRTLRLHRGLEAVTTQAVGTSSVVRDKANLVLVPPALVAVPRKAPRQLTAQDFYECSSSVWASLPFRHASSLFFSVTHTHTLSLPSLSFSPSSPSSPLYFTPTHTLSPLPPSPLFDAPLTTARAGVRPRRPRPRTARR